MKSPCLPLLGMGLALSTGCALPRREAKLPEIERSYVMVLSGEMPAAIEHVARHSWIIAHIGGEPALRKWELGSSKHEITNDAFQYFGDGDVAIHGVRFGTPDEIEVLSHCLDESVHGYRERHPTYNPIPGPNSNTIIAEALRDCSVHIELPATAIGRDYRGIIGAGITEAGTGVSFEAWLAGVRLGLQEGAEAHLAGLALGVHVWPPGITVPLNPGRIGIDGDMHHVTPRTEDHAPSSDYVLHETGIGVAHMFATVTRVREPSRISRLAERATVGLDGFALFTADHVVGYGFGADGELGIGLPASFAYAAHLYPVGFGAAFGLSSYVAVFGGFGASGVTERITGGLELPVEARAEFDVTRHARLGLHGAVQWVPWVDARHGAEWISGTFARFGPTIRHGKDREVFGRGFYFGFERHDLMGTYWLGLTLGAESVFGG